MTLNYKKNSFFFQVFLLEYTGPIFVYLLFYTRPSLIYGKGASDLPMADAVQ